MKKKRKKKEMAFQNYFTGKRVLVTGGGKGLGYDIAKRFHSDGAIVFIIDRDQNLLDNVNREVPEIHTICVDLVDWDKTQEAIKGILETGPLDHLVNNAGIIRMSPLLDITLEDFDILMNVNLRSMVCVSQTFAKGFIESGTNKGGTIVNLSSISDRVGFFGAGIYGVTKAAVARLTMAMGLEFAEYNIRVNCVNPSFVGTDLVASIPEEYMKRSAYLTDLTPIKEPIVPKDISDGVLFLSSPLSAKITGTSLAIDAGLSAV